MDAITPLLATFPFCKVYFFDELAFEFA
jgi:hypothetical protein